jgi:small basic protein (TIGR04137 family)
LLPGQCGWRWDSRFRERRTAADENSQQFEVIMSLDASLKAANALIRHRNVLTRDERLAKLKEDEKWQEGRSVFGLPKVGHRKMALAAKPAKEEAVEGATPAAGAAPAAAGAKGAAAAPAAKGGAPAKGAAPAKGGAPAAKGAAPAKAAAPAAKGKK